MDVSLSQPKVNAKDQDEPEKTRVTTVSSTKIYRTLPPFNRILKHTDGKRYAVGPRILPASDPTDLQNVTHDPELCQHPNSSMMGRGGTEDFRSWLCSACGARWEALPVVNYEKSLDEVTMDQDLITFGKYAGSTYHDLLMKDLPYCKWVISTAQQPS